MQAAAVYLKTSRNIDMIALEQMTSMMEVYRDLRAKVQQVKTILYPGFFKSNSKPDTNRKAQDFSDAVQVLTYYYSIPGHLLGYLAYKWKVDRGWVRNALVGWRRKLDPHLPFKMQIEPLTELMEELATHCKKFCTSDNEIKVIGILQKNHVLHLIKRAELEALLPNELREPYKRLKNKIKEYLAPLKSSIKAHSTRFKMSVFKKCAQALVQAVQTNIIDKDYKKGTTGYNDSLTFIKKVTFIMGNIDRYGTMLEGFIPGNRFTSALARLMARDISAKNSSYTYRRLFTAVRGIASRTFARTHSSDGPDGNIDATGKFKDVFTPDICLVKPYNGTYRKKSHLPLNLLFNKYVVERQAYPNKMKINKKGKKVKDYLNNEDAT
ncbi:MAG: hypothetical protein GF329_02295, partial [Candidatus Lokiarchaeota archaeon]|nr:hypothetical protein [Candidatus Lokiarchaeota archaeon]